MKIISAKIEQSSVIGLNMHNGKKARRIFPGKLFPIFFSIVLRSIFSFSFYLRARSIYERALDVDHRNINLWLKYTEMEMKNRQVNHARNVWDRAVTILPRANQFWYKYTYMEEKLGNIAGNFLDALISMFSALENDLISPLD